MHPQTKRKLGRSASDQNVFHTHVCLINNIKPNDHKSHTLHKLQDTDRNQEATTSGEESDTQNQNAADQNPNALSLKKMKSVTSDKDDGPSSTLPSMTALSSASSLSKESQRALSDKYLDTILRLDREHNLFGLSNIAIVGPQASKKIRKEEDKAVFHQEAIVQICCRGGSCCKNRSNTDLPTSLKCGGCKSCCTDACCSISAPYCPPFCVSDPCIDLPCRSKSCLVNHATCYEYGMKISVNRKPVYEPEPVEITPRSSSVLKKPVSARSCHHLPRCIPPSSCFPYLTPCFWPPSPGAPCSEPSRCFHTPPCFAPRVPTNPIPPVDACPKGGVPCEDKAKKTKCKNHACLGKNPEFSKAIESKYGRKTGGKKVQNTPNQTK